MRLREKCLLSLNVEKSSDEKNHLIKLLNVFVFTAKDYYVKHD